VGIGCKVGFFSACSLVWVGGKSGVEGEMGLVREGNNVEVMLAWCLLRQMLWKEGRDDAKQCNDASILDKDVMRSKVRVTPALARVE